MFESVIPATFVTRSRRLLYETLPVSVAVHALAIAGIAGSSIWDVAFPQQSPKISVAYSLTRVPDPPPPPPPPPSPQPAVVAPKPQSLPKPSPPLITQIVAPTVIPDTIPPVVEAAPAPPPPPPPVAAPRAVSETKGSVSGALNTTGDAGGKRWGAKGGIFFAEDGRVHVDRTEKLPLTVVDQEFPHYPDAARKDRLEDSLVVRYVIGTNGRVTDIAVLEHPKNPLFEAPTLDVIRRWRFRPMKMNGKAVEVVHEVEVMYEFNLR